LAFSERDFYDKLFTKYSELAFSNKELFKNHSIIDLMNQSNYTNNKMFAKNALLVIMALFNGKFRDDFHFGSKNIRNASDNSKSIIVSVLKEEFIS